jgi:hypothetical protein
MRMASSFIGSSGPREDGPVIFKHFGDARGGGRAGGLATAHALVGGDHFDVFDAGMASVTALLSLFYSG